MDVLTNMHRGLMAVAAALAMSLAPAARAQVTGAVREPGGIPVPDATVALWKGSREVARTFTDAEGNFRFEGDSSREATVLLVRRIGFGPTSISLGEKRTGLV